MARLALVALLLTAAQITLACALSPQPTWRKAYLSLNQWDSGWYYCIASDGYQSPEHITTENFGNFAFLPGYPLAVRGMHLLTGAGWSMSLLLTAQLAAWGFWTYFLLLLRQAGLPASLTCLAVLLLATQPAAFFLVAGYTESLFLFGMVGYLYWSPRRTFAAALLAAGHGLLMTSTRIVGLPLAIFPIVYVFFSENRFRDADGNFCWRRALQVFAVAGAAALGPFLFFAFAWYEFGRWDLYFVTEQAGWNVRANYLAFLGHKTYLPAPLFRVEDGFLDPNYLSQITVPATLIALGLLAFTEWRHRSAQSGWQQRLPYYVAGLLLFYVTVAGRYEVRMAGMIRYILCVEVWLLLAALPLLWQLGWRLSLRTRTGWALVLWLLVSLYGQMIYVWRFTQGKWVA